MATIEYPYSNPKFLYSVIAALQTALEPITWLDSIFPLAHIGTTHTQDVEECLVETSYPRVYKNNGTQEYADIRPDDKLKGFIFFETNGEYTHTRSNDKSVYPISLICWYSLKKIDVTKNYDYSEDLIGEVVMRTKDFYDDGEFFTEIRPTEIFNKYDFMANDLKYLGYPYGAFKITFNVDQSNNLNYCLTAFEPVEGDGCTYTTNHD